MPRDGSGNYSLPAGNPVISGTVISSAVQNLTLDDLAASMTDSLSRSGSGGMLVPFLNADGTAALPGISWSNQPSMGFYRPGLDEMRVSVAGVDKARFTSSALNPMDIFISSVWVPVMNEGGDYEPSGQWQFNLPVRLDYGVAVADLPNVGQIHAFGDDIFFVDQNGVSNSMISAGGAQISGTPVNNQLAVWINATTVEGVSGLVFSGSVLNIAASQAGLVLDETDGGGGSSILLTSTSTGARALRIFFDSSSGTAAHLQQTSDSGILEDTWISMFANGAVSFFWDGQNALRTSDNGGADVGMGAEVFTINGNFEPVGMNVLPLRVQNADLIVGLSNVGEMVIHDEVTPRTYSLNDISNTKVGSMWSVINDAGAGNILFQAGAGVIITFWNGASWTTSLVAGFVTAGEGQFTIYKRTDTEYYLTGPNLV